MSSVVVVPRRWAAALLLAPALALAQDPPEKETRTPSWALGDDRCSCTVIAPGVALTTLDCADEALHPTSASALVFTQRRTGARLPGVVQLRPKLAQLKPAGLVLVRFDGDRLLDDQNSPTLGAPIPSYVRENELLKDPPPGATRQQGTRLVVTKGGYMIRGYPRKNEQSVLFYDDRDRPLVYRSLAFLEKTEPQRFKRHTGTPLDWDDLLGEKLRDRQLSRRKGPQDPDDLVIPLVGESTDFITHRHPRFDVTRPFERHLGGSALMASFHEHPYPGAKRHVYLVGLVTGDGLFHARLSAHWPAIHAALVKARLSDAARHIATQVLDLKTWSPDRLGQVGDLYGHVHPTTGVLEFFRLRHVDADKTYWTLPVDGRDNTWWEYLGHRLPSRKEVLRPLPGNAP